MRLQLGPKHGNTRFNPTCTGDLHLGHVYLCMVNLYEAKARNANFYVRFDDTQLAWREHDSSHEEMLTFAERNREDLEWLGIPVDGWYYQSEMQERVREEIWRVYGIMLGPEHMVYDQLPIIKGMGDILAYPYAAPLVPEKVWMDFMMFCDLLIRGNDLLTEFSLYCYWVERFRLYRTYHIYLPRLLLASGDDPTYMGCSVTKTHGALTVRSLKEEGWTPDRILGQLRKSCLIDPLGDWSVENIKERPVWQT